MIDTAVIIVNYKTAALTEESIRSLQMEGSTSGIRIRVIVVDNASGEFPILTRAIETNQWSSWVTVVEAPKNGGFAYGNNLGIQRACGDAVPDYIHLLNPDAKVKPGAVGALIRFLEEHPSAGIAGSRIEEPHDGDMPIAFRFPGLLGELNQGLALGIVSRLLRRWIVARRMGDVAEEVDWVAGASMLIRANVFATIGGMDENYFLYFEETDFCFRARKAGFSTWYVPESRVMHLKGQSTGMTNHQDRPRRLPAYWFDSRRRYFVRSFGIGYAMAVDLVAVFAYSMGLAKHWLLGRSQTAIPRFVRDLLDHSVLRPRNRRIAPLQAPPFTQFAKAADRMRMESHRAT